MISPARCVAGRRASMLMPSSNLSLKPAMSTQMWRVSNNHFSCVVLLVCLLSTCHLLVEHTDVHLFCFVLLFLLISLSPSFTVFTLHVAFCVLVFFVFGWAFLCQ